MVHGTISCLTCFADIPESAISKCVIHSCCSRAICTRCLNSRPRLSTFCPFCDSIQHAFRKGPRNDVTRAGQIIFQVKDADIEIFNDAELSAPPPAYQQDAVCTTTITNTASFVIDDKEKDDDKEEGDDGNENQLPQLLRSFRTGEKQAPLVSQIDFKGPRVEVTSLEQSPSANLLRSTLSVNNSPPDEEMDTTKRNLKSSIKTYGKIDSNLDKVLTRQYWLRPNDTLISLCLRFKVNSAVLCKLNDLPLSTANTTPHLIHTRQFLLIPEGAIQSALSSSCDASALQSALDGPVAQSKRQKIQRARREAESRFRALITKSESFKKGKGKAISDGFDITLCDARAARAYIALVEDDFRYIDFGDENQQEFKSDPLPQSDNLEEVEELDASVEAGRRERYNVIVKQAIARWEMDSDWERKQRTLGMSPEEMMAPQSAPFRKCNIGEGSRSEGGWLHNLLYSSATINTAFSWPEKSC